jgi:ABC-type bacteriocin/lantibiotic exporter with double-glycine peptidase domain
MTQTTRTTDVEMRPTVVEGVVSQRATQQTLDAIRLGGDKLGVRNLDFYYGQKQALKGISMGIHANKVTAFIGPSGCGKSTLLRCFNRMNEMIPGHAHDRGSVTDGRSRHLQERRSCTR